MKRPVFPSPFHIPPHGAGIGRRTLLAAAAGLLATGPRLARAEPGFPTHPLKMIVPFAPGNSTDQIARSVAADLSRELGQGVVVENKAGASAKIAAQYVISQRADGYTLFLASDSALVLNPLLYRNPGYDPERDFQPVTQIVDVPLVMVVSPTLGVRTVAEFVAHAKAHPDTLNFGSTGIGGAFHLTGELFKQKAGIAMTHVPYKGGAPAVQAMIAGEIQVLFGVVGSTLPFIRSGQMVPLAVCTRERVPVLPDVPTIAASGYPGFDATVRYGVVVARATPPEVVERLAAALDRTIDARPFRTLWTEQGYVIPAQRRPAAYAASLKTDRATWSRLIKSRGIVLEE